MSNVPQIYQEQANELAEMPLEKTNVGSVIRFGVLILICGIGAFFLWANLAPLSSATIAPGVVVVESSRQQIEHLEGGIVRSLSVRDGSVVEAGDVLLELESEASESRLEQADRRLISLMASRDRLMAELQKDEEISFDDRLLDRIDQQAVREDIELQRELFRQRRDNLGGQQALLVNDIEQSRAKIRSFNARLSADERRLELTRQRVASAQQLLDKGLMNQSAFSEILAQEANLQGSVLESLARIDEVELFIAGTQKELVNMENEFVQGVLEELQRVETELDEFDASVAAAGDVVARMQVVAPVGGTVVGLAVTSIGSVVDGGERLMEIVPAEDLLVVDALVRPEDIDVVFVGQEAQVRLTAFNQRNTPPVVGEIVSLSADRVLDERSGVAAYSAKVELDLETAGLPEGQSLYPGMPAEVMIINGTRTFVEYLLGPILELFQRGLRE